MGRPEAYVEKYLVAKVQSTGGVCYKFTSGTLGVPDRIVIAFGHTLFIECKAPNEKPRPSQLIVIREMRDAGADVRVFDSREQVDELVKEIETWKQAFQPGTQQVPLPVKTIPLSGHRSATTSA